MDRRAAIGKINSEILRCQSELRGLKGQRTFLRGEEFSGVRDDDDFPTDLSPEDEEFSGVRDDDDFPTDLSPKDLKRYEYKLSFGSYEELWASDKIFRSNREMLKTFKDNCDALGAALSNFRLECDVHSQFGPWEAAQFVKCLVERLDPGSGFFEVTIGDLENDHTPIVSVSVDGRAVYVLGHVHWETFYKLESVLRLPNFASGKPNFGHLEEIEDDDGFDMDNIHIGDDRDH